LNGNTAIYAVKQHPTRADSGRAPPPDGLYEKRWTGRPLLFGGFEKDSLASHFERSEKSFCLKRV